ncbi:hypothetical protein HD806DRAFT_143877 [Xylariaceae sp. AK1471]|nr:hypothetical protein HD806DRAFT_143877 [Xylariaceae sp. AK1471]
MSDNEGTIVALSPLDNRMVPSWVKLLFYFTMPAEASVSGTYETLRKGLNMAIAERPICGSITLPRPPHRDGWKPGQIECRIPNGVGLDGAYPLEFRDLTDKLSYEELRARGFPMEEIDTKLLMTKSCNSDLAAGIQTTAAQANFVKGGCLLALAMWHHTTDAHGVYVFARAWASHCNKLQTEQDWEFKWRQNLKTTGTAVDNDRKVLERIWRHEGGLESVVASDRQWDICGLYPPNAKDALSLDQFMARAMGSVDRGKKVVNKVLSIPASSLEQLKNDTKGASGDLISADDALHALLWRGTMRARYPTPGDESSGYQIAFDARQKLGGGQLDSYLGNAFYFATASMPMPQLITPSTPLNHLAQILHKMMDSISHGDLLRAYGVAHNLPSYINLQYNLAGFGPSVVVVDHRHFPLPELNFGPALGSPDCERPPGEEWDDLFRRIIILPDASGDGVEVLVQLFDYEMISLQKDEEFSRYVKF